jgi:hypothetical protein
VGCTTMNPGTRPFRAIERQHAIVASDGDRDVSQPKRPRAESGNGTTGTKLIRRDLRPIGLDHDALTAIVRPKGQGRAAPIARPET